MTEGISRVDAEWVALNAFRGLTRIASKGDDAKSTYNNALDLGGELYPELLGPETSLLRRERESDTTKEYRQKARLTSLREQLDVSPLVLVRKDIQEMAELLSLAKQSKSNQTGVDQLKKRLSLLERAERELNPVAHSEHQLIFRDVYNVQRNLPALGMGQGYRDFELPDENILRIRVLHPDKPEHISGADIIYERHYPNAEMASIVAVQYKIWTDKVLYLSDRRMAQQLKRLKSFICNNKICKQTLNAETYRFPCCAAFLRPTDKLQQTDQRYYSSGEHLPICRIDECTSTTDRNSAVLEYDKIRHISLNSEMFEYLFNKGKIGSRPLTYDELKKLYADYMVATSRDNVVIHAQEFTEKGARFEAESLFP